VPSKKEKKISEEEILVAGPDWADWNFSSSSVLDPSKMGGAESPLPSLLDYRC
jgi:hypothetical protein